MPTYQYRCAQCGEQFEAWQSIHDDALTVHDSCGGALSRVFGVTGIVLKGPGFYRTDNRSKSGGRDRTGDGDSKQTAASGNGSGDSKQSDSDSKKSDSGSKKSDSGSKKSDSGSKRETASSGASKTDASKS